MVEEPRETRNKLLIIVLCLSGIISVGYGVIMDSDGVFVLGIICVIAGYLLIRRKLKESLQEKND